MIMSGRTALAAGASNNNFFAGSPFEFTPDAGVMEFGALAGDIAGITTGDIEIDVLCGGTALALNHLVTSLGTAFRMPIYPDDYTLSEVCEGGDRLIGKVRNLDAANAAALYWGVVFNLL